MGFEVERVVAPNGGPFTAEGTNTWILGGRDVCVVDPGPDDAAHLAAVLAALRGRRVEAIVVTHAHEDHSGLAAALARATGAEVLAFGDAGAGVRAQPGWVGGGWGVDEGFAPDRTVADGEAVAGTGWRLRAIHTPGHMGNHLCLDDGERLWTGDHAMGFATSVVSPPEGDMGDYLDSLDRLLAIGERSLWPGHGAVVADGAARIAALAAHRRSRQTEVLAALGAEPVGAGALAARMYAGIDPRLRVAAERTVLAHLLHLARDGRAVAEGSAFRRA